MRSFFSEWAKNMKGTILQPTYLPWLGYFEIIDSVDVFVVFDHVQFERKSWQQRNRIKTRNGVVTLTLPIKRKGRNTRICDAEISHNPGNPLEKHWKTITLAYKKTPFFNKYESTFQNLYSEKYDILSDLNFAIIETISKILGLDKKIIFSSRLNLDDENMGKTEKIVNLCKKVGITSLYDGKSAADFLNTSVFDKEGISVTFQSYKHPIYRQSWGHFVAYLSVIDLLFNEGDSSIEIIRSGRQHTS
jgi:hypothetical protein